MGGRSFCGGRRAQNRMSTRVCAAVLLIMHLGLGQADFTPVLEKFVGATISWQIDYGFLTATTKAERKVHVTLTTAWLTRDYSTRDDSLAAQCFQPGSAHSSADCETGSLIYWQCDGERCRSLDRFDQQEIPNDMETINDYALPAFNDAAERTVHTGRFTTTITLDTDTLVLMVAFKLPSATNKYYWPLQLSVQGEDDLGYHDLDYWCRMDGNCQHLIFTEFSDVLIKSMIAPTWIRVCQVGGSAGCQVTGVRKRVQNFHSPKIEFPLMLFTNAHSAGPNNRRGTHIKVTDYDGQYLNMFQRSCLLDSFESAECTGGATGAIAPSTPQKVNDTRLLSASAMMQPTGAHSCAARTGLSLGETEDTTNCLAQVRQAIEIHDMTWTELGVQRQISVNPDHYIVNYSAHFETTPSPSVYEEGTTVGAVFSTWYTSSTFTTQGTSNPCTTQRAPVLEFVGNYPNNEMECIWNAPASEACSFSVRGYTEGAVTDIRLELAPGFDESLLPDACTPSTSRPFPSTAPYERTCTISPLTDWAFVLPELAGSDPESIVGTSTTVCMFASSVPGTVSPANGGVAACPSEVQCLRIKFKGNAPAFDSTVTPLQANSRDDRGVLVAGRTDVPACLGYPISLNLKATDKDPSDSLRIYVEEITATPSYLGRNAFFGPNTDYCGTQGACTENGQVTYEEFGAVRVGDTISQTTSKVLDNPPFDSTVLAEYDSDVTFVMNSTVEQSIIYELSVGARNGLFVQTYCIGGTKDCRQRQLNYDPVICGAAYDNSKFRFKKWQGAPADISSNVHGFGDATSPLHCWRIRLQAPPVFTTNISGCASSLASTTFDCTPFPDGAAPNIVSTTANNQAYRSIFMPVGTHLRAVITAEDPNPSDNVEIFVLENPGIPPGMTVGSSVCENRPTMTQRYCGAKEPTTAATFGGQTAQCAAMQNEDISSGCSKVSRTLDWTTKTTDAGTNFLVCFVARDDSTLCQGQGPPDASSAGWYGEQHCLNLTVIAPQFQWDQDFVDEYVLSSEPHEAFVGCTFSLPVSVVETSFLGSGISASYGLEVNRADTPSAVEAAGRIQIQNDRSPAEGSVFVISPQLGSEGHTIDLCFSGGDSQGMVASTGYCDAGMGQFGYKRCDATTPCEVGNCVPVCVKVQVQKCRYCVRDGDTLTNVIIDLMLDTNWLKLWTLNADNATSLGTQCSKELDCAMSQDVAIDNPELMLKSDVSAGVRGKKILWTGLLYKAYEEESIARLACRFKTTMKSFRAANPELPVGAEVVSGGTEVCMISCNNRRQLQSDLDTINC